MAPMSETTEPVEGAPAETTPADEAPAGSHRLWAVLLVLDAAFVIVFAGLVASKLYQHWMEPVRAAAKVSRRAKAPPPLPAAVAPPAVKIPQAQAAAPAPAPTPAAPAVAPAPAPRAAPQSPAPTKARAASRDAATTVSAARSANKARAVDFRLRARRATSVDVVGAFIVHGGHKAMTRKANGVWTVRLYLNPGRYHYFFLVDGKRELDPSQPAYGSDASLLTVH